MSAICTRSRRKSSTPSRSFRWTTSARCSTARLSSPTRRGGVSGTVRDSCCRSRLRTCWARSTPTPRRLSVVTDTLRDLVELAIVVDPTFDQNCYVLHRRDTSDALVVDPGLQYPQTLDVLEKRGLRCDRILLTHGHPDHVSGVPALKAVFGCEAAIHPDDREQLEAVHYLPGVPDDLPDVVCEQDLNDREVLHWHGL